MSKVGHHTKPDIPRESRNLYSTLTIAFACIGSLTYGYCAAVIGTTLGQTSFLTYTNLDTRSNAETLIAAMNGLYQAGGLIGCLFSSFASDKYGRRPAMAFAAVVAVIGGALQAGTVTIEMFIAGRFITGLGTGMLVTMVPVWQSEVAAPHSRGLLVGLHGVAVGTGYGTGGWVGYGFFFVNAGGAQWRIPLALQVIFPSILAAGIFFVPESPRWLLQHGREQEALDVCVKIRGNPADPDSLFAHDEFNRIKSQQEYDATMPSSWMSILTVPSYRKRAMIAFSALFFAQTTGTQVINNYGALIYSSLGFTGSKIVLLSACWLTCAAPGNLLGALIMDRVGRVNMMLIGLIGTAVALVGASASIAIASNSGNTNKAALNAAVFFIFLHVGIYTVFTDGPSFVYGAELWPTHLRSRGNAIAVSGLYVSSLILLSSASAGFGNTGWKYYLVFLASTVVGIVVTKLYFPEFSGMSLEETAGVFDDHVEPPRVEEIVLKSERKETEV